MKNTKRSLITSLTSLLLCFAMLLGTTFAWFTDVASSKGNKIMSGNLEFDLELLDKETNEWNSIKDSNDPLFYYENWEPGYVDFTILKVENEGDLALKWIAKFVSDTDFTALADVIDVYLKSSDDAISYPSDNSLAGYEKQGTIREFINDFDVTKNGVLYPEGSDAGASESYLGIALKMSEKVGNSYQNMSINGGTFDIQILATQYNYETGSFGSDYDADAQYPMLTSQHKYLTAGMDSLSFTLTHNGNTIATMSVPAGAVADPVYPVTVTISDMDPTETIVLDENVKAFAYDIEVTNLKDDLSGDNLVSVTLNVPAALPMAQVYHNGELVADAVYDEVAGTISFNTASFSPYAVSWKEREASTVTELRDAITGDDDVYIRLTADLNFYCDPTTAEFNGSESHMAKSSAYTYYNGVNVVGKNIAIDLNGHNITSYGETGAIFFVTPGSSLNITDTVGGGQIIQKDLGYVIWAPYDDPSFCDIFNGIFVTDSYAGITDTSKYGRAIVYAGEGGNINVYGGYYLYNNTPDDNSNNNNGAFNVMDNYIPEENPCLTIYDGVMLINQYYRQSTGKDDATVKLADGCSIGSVTLSSAVAGYKNWYQVQSSDPEFANKFVNIDKYTYRLGNSNNVALGSIFAPANAFAKNTTNITVNVETLSGNVTATYTANVNDWAQSTIKFSGTGLAKITINNCELTVEIVNAANATSATSVKSNNVVLLNNVGFSTLEVSGGYTLYGNGFKMTASNDVMYDAMGVGFVALKNGTLDNVQIICPNFSYSIIYSSQIKSSDNTAVPSDSSNDARGNVRSAVMVDGNSKIVNSYIHGGRAAVYLRSGNLLIDASTISGGAAANIHALSAQSLTLRNATLIQKPFQATVHDTSKTVMGFSGLFECGADGNSTPVILEGTLVQDAWINKDYQKYVPSDASSIVSTALGKANYLHDIDGDGTNESLNLGFTYIPQDVGGSTNVTVTDNRTNKDSIPYSAVDVGNVLASAKVFSYTNGKGTSSDFTNVTYEPFAQGVTAPTVSFTDTNTNRVFETKFDTSDNRWESTLTVDLDSGNYNFSFANLLVLKHGANLAYTVATADGTAVSTSTAIALTSAGVKDYVLTVKDGDATHTIYFTITASKTSIPDPVATDKTNDGPHLLVVKSKNSDWSCAIDALTGVQVKYYTSATNEVILDLSSFAPTNTGKLNGTNNYWEATNTAGCKLKITCGYIHEGKQVYGMPIGVNNGGNKVYFTISNTNGYVSTSTSARAVSLTYEFTDPNGKTITFSNSTTFTYANYKDVAQYSYSDFVNGTLTDLLTSSGGSSSCITPDTLITLADGTKVRVDSLTGSEELLVWNMETGKFDKAPIMFVDNDPEANYNVIKLTFSDGTTVNAIYEHGFWDYDLNRYVYLDENAADYIGHTFAKQNGDKLEKVTLVDVTIENELTTAWSPVTVGHLCYFVNDMLSMPGGVGGLFNIFEVNPETMTYDYEQIEKDIETYGLFTYEELNAICPLTEDMFYAAGGAYLKISIGKGNMTLEELIAMINRYSKYI